ncbi:Transmembrane emp24 domain-containing protein 6 [Liparis tanakae]|uniref:Transmembrane emp24 domain-containing protein 6 n=1 Tax=Liparis tanakae TaxID=230148 RepID=A0A4Z2GGY4_9TELE|nr:Transmembrane emp24 domain-containing protein 6 [Liparis tanakae]
MWSRIPLLCLVLALVGPAGAGPLADPHPGMTDQQLFWGSDQYDFSVVLPAAGLDCFWHFAHRGERHLSVTVNAPSGLMVSTADDPKGQINFEAEETDVLQ